jgi:hypothetical protein
LTQPPTPSNANVKIVASKTPTARRLPMATADGREKASADMGSAAVRAMETVHAVGQAPCVPVTVKPKMAGATTSRQATKQSVKNLPARQRAVLPEDP